MSNVDSRADDPFKEAGPARGQAGGYDPAHSNPTGSVGGDAGMQVGGDEEYANEISDPPEPQQGIAGRAAREDAQEQDSDTPAEVGGTRTTTPGYTP